MNQIYTDQTRLLGVGIYGVAEAARLIDVPAARIRRWLRGDSYKTLADDYLRRRANYEIAPRARSLAHLWPYRVFSRKGVGFRIMGKNRQNCAMVAEDP